MVVVVVVGAIVLVVVGLVVVVVVCSTDVEVVAGVSPVLVEPVADVLDVVSPAVSDVCDVVALSSGAEPALPTESPTAVVVVDAVATVDSVTLLLIDGPAEMDSLFPLVQAEIKSARVTAIVVK